jgi:outer membrane protein insertion porin family
MPRFDRTLLASARSAFAEESLRRIRLTIPICALFLLVPWARSQEPPQPKAAMAPAPASTVDALEKYQGIRVAKIQVQAPASLRPDALQHLLAQKEGEPFDKEKVRRTLEALYETGRFADLEVRAEPLPNQEITLIFAGHDNYFVGFISAADAPGPPSRADLVEASKLQLGELLTPDKMQTAMARLRDVMQENGYYESKITPEEVNHPETQQTDVTFHITAGPQARVGNLTFEGSPGETPAELERIAKMHPRDYVSATRTTRALQRIRQRYANERRLEAQVSLINRTYHGDSNTVDYDFHIVRGPVIHVRVEGAKVSTAKLKRLVPIYEENAVDQDLLNEGRRNLRNYFQTKGFFDAVVTVREQRDPDQPHNDFIYDVDLGKKHKLTEVVITGNRFIPDDLVRDRLLVQPAGTLLEHGRYSESDLAGDVASIEALYRANGFEDVKVISNVQDDYKGEPGRMHVEYNITEGTQTLVNGVSFSGNTSVPAEQLQGLVNSAVGQPFSPAAVASDRTAISNYYFNTGFPDVRVEANVANEGTPPQASVAYRISEGEQVFVDKVLISGLQFTRPNVVQREFQLWDGDPLSQVRELDTQRRLYDLGIFNSVKMAVQNPEGDAQYKNLVVQFEEARRYTFNYGVGFEVQTGFGVTSCPGPSNSPTVLRCKAQVAATSNLGWGPRVSFDLSRLNFRGRNHTITLNTSYGKLVQRASASYQAPRWLDRPNLKLTFNGYYNNSHEISTFKSERIEGSAQVEQRWSRITTTLYRFTYRLVEASEIQGCTATSASGATQCSSSPVLSLTQIPLLSEPVRVGMPSVAYIRNKRDNDLQSTRGNFTTGDVGVASGIFGSQANFFRSFLQNSTYVSFKVAGGLWTLARSTQIGVEQPFGSGLNVAPPASSTTPCNPALNNGSNAGCNSIIPLAERFFAGGSTSLRAYSLNQAGPRDPVSGDPIGGAGQFVNMVELRTPPLLLPFVQDNLSLVMFEDAGNVFANASDIFPSLGRWHQTRLDECRAAAQFNSTTTCDFNYLTHAAGLGLRYRTPIGPVRVDFSYALNPPYYAERDLICLPNEVCPANQPSAFRRLGHFNFFFSVGQTF